MNTLVTGGAGFIGSNFVKHILERERNDDRIIVLEKGSIAETGTHNELMEKKGVYYNMYRKQSSRFGIFE